MTVAIAANDTRFSALESPLAKSAKKDKEAETASTFNIPYKKELSPDEKKRLEYLKDLLAETLASADTPPTKEQAARIRKVEKEIEKLTGVSMGKTFRATNEDMPFKSKDDDDDKDDPLKTKKKIAELGIKAHDFAIDTGNGAMSQFMQNNSLHISLDKLPDMLKRVNSRT